MITGSPTSAMSPIIPAALIASGMAPPRRRPPLQVQPGHDLARELADVGIADPEQGELLQQHDQRIEAEDQGRYPGEYLDFQAGDIPLGVGEGALQGHPRW